MVSEDTLVFPFGGGEAAGTRVVEAGDAMKSLTRMRCPLTTEVNPAPKVRNVQGRGLRGLVSSVGK